MNDRTTTYLERFLVASRIALGLAPASGASCDASRAVARYGPAKPPPCVLFELTPYQRVRLDSRRRLRNA